MIKPPKLSNFFYSIRLPDGLSLDSLFFVLGFYHKVPDHNHKEYDKSRVAAVGHNNTQQLLIWHEEAQYISEHTKSYNRNLVFRAFIIFNEKVNGIPQ